MEVAQNCEFELNIGSRTELNISSRTNSSGCDVDDVSDSSTEDFGMSPLPHPRKLSFMDCDSEVNEANQNNSKTAISFMTG